MKRYLLEYLLKKLIVTLIISGFILLEFLLLALVISITALFIHNTEIASMVSVFIWLPLLLFTISIGTDIFENSKWSDLI